MRKIDLVEPTTVAWQNWKERCNAARLAAIATAGAGEVVRITNLYKEQKRWFRDLGTPFGGKCAYCEVNVAGNQRGDVEHYRPKAAVQYEDGTPVERLVDGSTIQHPGYYWLAYDIHNLLLACIACNQLNADPAYGKGNKFPITGEYAWAPGAEAGEEPKLLHPCLDNAYDHLSFTKDTGILTPVTERGRATIDVLGLNLRDLPQARLRTYRAVSDRFDLILAQRRFRPQGWARQELLALANDTSWDYASVAGMAVRDAADSVLSSVGEV